MKAFYLFFILIAALPSAYASGRKPADVNILARFVVHLEAFRQEGLIDDLNEWSDIEILPLEKQGALLGSYSADRPNISDFFVILPSSDNLSLGQKSLRIVSAKPFNLTKWYRSQSADKAATAEERDARLAEYDSLNPEDEIIRWYAAKDINGEFTYDSISEVEFARLIDGKNIKIPSVSPYRIDLTKHGLVDSHAPTLSINTTTATQNTKTAEIPATASASTSSTKQPANLVWWIVGVIILTACVVFVVRKKKWA
jgi:hypothetical protein